MCQKPSDGPILGDRKGGELPVECLHNRFNREWVFSRMRLRCCKMQDLMQDVQVLQLDGHVERIVYAVHISLPDEWSHNVGARAAVVINKASVNVVSSGVAENTSEDFFPDRPLSESAVNPSQSAL